jgi:hypothetical protein
MHLVMITRRLQITKSTPARLGTFECVSLAPFLCAQTAHHHSTPLRRYWSESVQGKYPVLMRKRVGHDLSSEVVIDQNEIAKKHSYVGVMNERLSRDSSHGKVAFAVDTDGHQRWQVRA